jgi:NDP-sugar pyrophosphorylase family protein
MMKAVIMAGGLGERLRPLTQIFPKPLLPVGNRSVLQIQIDNLKSRGATDIYLALGYKHELFEFYFGDGSRWGVKIHYSVEEEPLGTAGPLTLLHDRLDEPFLVINGDILTNLDYAELRRAHSANAADITVATKVITLPLQYGVIHYSGDDIVDIEEKPSLYAEINAGIYFMNPDVIDLIPPGAPFSMDQLLKKMIAEGQKVARFLMSDYWLDIGQMSDFEKANDFVESHRLALEK